ncbi:MAG: protoporphyrinogen oxidase [Planctomycetaceae bacterium]
MSTVHTDAKRRIAVIGGGLAGLTAALRLIDLARQTGRPIDVTVFEAADRLGGAIETTRIRGYLVERGADSFLTKPPIVKLCERLGLSNDLLPTDPQFRGALVLRKGRPVRVPEGFGLMAPAKLWPIVKTPVLSTGGKLRLLAERFVPKRTVQGDESLGAFVRRRLGDEVFERLVQPLVAGIYTADPEKLSLAATLPRFLEMERTHGSLIRAMRRSPQDANDEASGARYGLFAGLRDGMEQLFAALRREVQTGATIRLGSRVGALRRERGEWRIEMDVDGPQSLGFDAVILALPAYASADLLSRTAGGLVSLLRLIPYASSAVVVTGHRRKDVSHPLDAFGLVIPAIEKRDALAVSFASRKFPHRAPKDRVLLRTFVGGATRPEMLARSDDELVAIVRKELGALLGVSGLPDLTLVTRYEDAMPQYHVGHLDLIAEIEAAANRQPALELTGSAYRGVGIPDVVADAERAATRIFEAATIE